MISVKAKLLLLITMDPVQRKHFFSFPILLDLGESYV